MILYQGTFVQFIFLPTGTHNFNKIFKIGTIPVLFSFIFVIFSPLEVLTIIQKIAQTTSCNLSDKSRVTCN